MLQEVQRMHGLTISGFFPAESIEIWALDLGSLFGEHTNQLRRTWMFTNGNINVSEVLNTYNVTIHMGAI